MKLRCRTCPAPGYLGPSFPGLVSIRGGREVGKKILRNILILCDGTATTKSIQTFLFLTPLLPMGTALGFREDAHARLVSSTGPGDGD